MAEVDGLLGPKVEKEVEKGPGDVDIGSVADFMELINATVGKHFKCCICFRSVYFIRVIFYVQRPTSGGACTGVA